MKTEYKLSIKDIENLSENDVKKMTDDVMQIKDHAVYFVDLGGWFQYSALVFCNGHHIYYANEYELHYDHMHWTRDVLREKFIEKINNKLFTDDELRSGVSNYDEKTRKEYYIRNYYNMRVDYVTVFCINPTEDQEREFRKKTASMTYDPLSFCYIADPDFVKNHVKLYNDFITAAERSENDFDYMKDAFIREMYNHEYCINWEADFDTLSAFGNIDYSEDATLETYFKQLGFNETQKKAYRAARTEYYKQIAENDDNY